jgi:phi13 family phage major tail protein
MDQKNKVMFGIKNVHIHPFSDDGAAINYDTALNWPGTVTLTLDPAGDRTDFYADNGLYFSQDNNQGFTGKIESALMPFEISSVVLGDRRDDNGVIAQSIANGEPVAVTFEFDGDKKATRHILYNVSFSRATEEGETKSDKADVKTSEFSITAALDPYLEIAKAKTDEATDQATYDAWYTTPYRVSMGQTSTVPEV